MTEPPGPPPITQISTSVLGTIASPASRIVYSGARSGDGPTPKSARVNASGRAAVIRTYASSAYSSQPRM